MASPAKGAYKVLSVKLLIDVSNHSDFVFCSNDDEGVGESGARSAHGGKSCLSKR